jgi:hypothetical protein
MFETRDEVAFIDKDEMKSIDKFLRKGLKIKKKFILLVTTPLGTNWLYDYYEKKKEADAHGKRKKV